MELLCMLDAFAYGVHKSACSKTHDSSKDCAYVLFSGCMAQVPEAECKPHLSYTHTPDVKSTHTQVKAMWVAPAVLCCSMQLLWRSLHHECLDAGIADQVTPPWVLFIVYSSCNAGPMPCIKCTNSPLD